MRKVEAAVLAVVLAAGTALCAAEPVMPGNAPKEPAAATTPATTAEATSAPNAAVPAVPATAHAPLTYYAPGAGPASGCGHNCPWDHADGHCPCLRRLIAWATYCPKERVCTLGGCNSCGYKGVLPIHVFFGRYCVNGCGEHATYPNPTCCHGCKGGPGCASGGCP
jgi:hypothetical protein